MIPNLHSNWFSNNISRVLKDVKSFYIFLLSDNLKSMKIRKKYSIYLLIAVLSFIGLVLFINTFEPSKIIDLFYIKVYPEIILFLLLFSILTCLLTFTFASIRRGIISGILITSIALLQFFKVNNLFYSAILVVVAILLEFLFWKKK